MEKFFDFIKKHGDLFTFLGLLIVCYFIFFFNIGNYPLMDVDETRYVSMARGWSLLSACRRRKRTVDFSAALLGGY